MLSISIFLASLNKLRVKLGPKGNLMVVLDACHSGTGTRGMGIARGTMEPNVPQDWKAPSINSRGSENAENTFGFEKSNSQMSTMACFYESSSFQLNYEYQPAESPSCGSLSYAVSRALSDVTPQTS